MKKNKRNFWIVAIVISAIGATVVEIIYSFYPTESFLVGVTVVAMYGVIYVPYKQLTK